MDETERLKARWAQFLDRAGAEGRAWRKSLVLRQVPAEDAQGDLKRRIKALRAARALGHWSFKPELLRALLRLYLGERARRRRAPPDH